MLYEQKSCLLNGVLITKYFNLEKGTCQGDPVSGYLFISLLKIIFLLTKIIPQERVLKFSTVFLDTAYAYDSTFFLKNLASVKKLLDIFSYYSQHSGSKSNFYNCEIAGIGSLKGDEVAVPWYNMC